MERVGLLTRKVYPTVPPKVEYTLTELGFTLITMLEQIRNWSENNIEAVLAAQTSYDSQVG
jgi:DNA-binding HxlR family transcriptional regulator